MRCRSDRPFADLVSRLMISSAQASTHTTLVMVGQDPQRELGQQVVRHVLESIVGTPGVCLARQDVVDLAFDSPAFDEVADAHLAP